MPARLSTLAVFIASAVAQSVSTSDHDTIQTSIVALFGSISGDVVASVVAADDCDTTMAMNCAGTVSCPPMTVTQGPDKYVATFGISGGDAQGLFVQSCDLFGLPNSASSAVCHQYVSMSVAASTPSVTSTTTTSIVATVAGSWLTYQTFLVTAGADILEAVPKSCSDMPMSGPT